MTDPHEPRPDVTPPPSPWWARPEGRDTRGPGQTTATAAAPTGPGPAPAGEPGRPAQPPYGSYAAPTVEQPRPLDPWRSPQSTAVFGPGPVAWGDPADSIGRPAAGPASPRRNILGTLALVLVTALVAGGVGGYLGTRSAGGSNLLDPSASLGTGGGTSAPAALDRAPESVAGIAARVIKSTVSIAVQGGGQSGTGSGVVIRSDGYILTNNHVVMAAANGGSITVTFDQGAQEVPARIVGRDPITDLAVLRVTTDKQLQAATLGRSADLVVGDPVIAIGSPLGLSGTVTSGIISALNRTVDVPAESGRGSNPLFNAIQTDAAINPGNSGGALVNAKGEVIGINTAIATLGGGGSPFGGQTQGGSIGVGFAIPVDEARSVAEEIIRTGKATHPAIGVAALTVKGPSVDQSGARIQQLTAGGAAEQAGMQVGDLIVRVGNDKVSSVDELILAIRKYKVGDQVSITYVRQGQSRTAQVRLQDRPS